MVNLYISYLLNEWSKDLNADFTLGNCLFGAVKLTKKADPDKYEHSGYGIGFDSRSQFSWTNESNGKMLLILQLIIVLLCILIIEIKNILVLVEGSTKSLEDATITAAAKYPFNFTESEKWFVLRLHYSGSNSSLFAFFFTVKLYLFRAKDSEIKPYQVCLSNVSKDFKLGNMKKQDYKEI